MIYFNNVSKQWNNGDWIFIKVGSNPSPIYTHGSIPTNMGLNPF